MMLSKATIITLLSSINLFGNSVADSTFVDHAVLHDVSSIIEDSPVFDMANPSPPVESGPFGVENFTKSSISGDNFFSPAGR